MKSCVFNVLPDWYKPVRASYNIKISKIASKDLKKDICWFWKTKLNGNKTQEKTKPEEKFIALNAVDKKQKKNGKFFKGDCKKCRKYGHIASDCWENNNKVIGNINDNNNHERT